MGGLGARRHRALIRRGTGRRGIRQLRDHSGRLQEVMHGRALNVRWLLRNRKNWPSSTLLGTQRKKREDLSRRDLRPCGKMVQAYATR